MSVPNTIGRLWIQIPGIDGAILRLVKYKFWTNVINAKVRMI